MFGNWLRRPPASATAVAAGDGVSVSLSDLVTGVCRSVFDGSRMMRDQHIAAAADLYTIAPGDTADAPPTLTPKSLLMRIPAFNPLPSAGEPAPVEVPIAALAQHNPVVISEASFELTCSLDRVLFNDQEVESVGVRLDRPSNVPAMRLMVKFTVADPPEGLSRVNDALLRNLQ